MPVLLPPVPWLTRLGRGQVVLQDLDLPELQVSDLQDLQDSDLQDLQDSDIPALLDLDRARLVPQPDPWDLRCP